MLESHGDYRVFTDADFSTPIRELEKVLPILDRGADVCIGSRAMDPTMIKEHQPFYREFMGKTFNKFVTTLFFSGIKDTQCGFKGFRAGAAEKIFSLAKIDGFSFDVEALYLAKILNLSVEQVPVEWYNDERSTVNPITDSISMFLELLKIRGLHKKK
jgi:dolichyl-phosphate beta-glucosyltransferase